MGFIMDGLDAEEYDRTYSDRELVRRILSYFRPELSRMLAVAFMVVLTSLVQTALPIFVSYALDQLVQDISTQRVLGIGGVVTLLGVLSWAFNAVRRWLATEAIGNVVLKLREDAFDAVLRRDLSFYDT